MGTAGNDPQVMQFPPIDQKRARKNYANPNDLRHTFEALSNLHKLLPNHRMETLHSYKSDEDRKKCMWLKKNLHPTEDLKSVMDLLSAFGPIQSVTACGRQSAIVVFSDINSACKAVSAFHSKVPGSTLQCSWQQRFMAKDVRFSITKRLCEFF
ncbi:hypothetical protein H920_04747 [Fukomys damarensis]|uniref:RRM domain-containing protein n=1 Tax=Fukomys damarensis TaxID=885580 RepID=A0A091DTH6_FUKDA|nr:hypothetical protein H920_04747 [Fukomys damarensis]